MIFDIHTVYVYDDDDENDNFICRTCLSKVSREKLPLSIKYIYILKFSLLDVEPNLISESSFLEMCTERTISSQGSVYVVSSNYPHTVSVSVEMSCNCSVAVFNNSYHSKNAADNTTLMNVTMVTIHIEVQLGQQLIVMSPDSAFLRNITKDTAQYEISFEQYPYSELNLLWRSNASGSKSLFWIGFQSMYSVNEI